MSHSVNWTKQAGLAALLFVLGTGAIWYEYKGKPQKATREEENKKLLALKGKKVEKIEIRISDSKSFVFECAESSPDACQPGSSGKWKLTQPIQVTADAPNVNSLVSSINQLTPSETFSLSEETPEKKTQLLKDYELNDEKMRDPSTPKITVTYGPGSAGKKSIVLGATHPIGDALFARLISEEGDTLNDPSRADTVYLLPPFFKSHFDKNLTHWRDKKITAFAAHEVESFELRGAQIDTQGVRKDGNWTLTPRGGRPVPGDIENIDNLISAASFLSAKDFAMDRKDSPEAKKLLAGKKPVLSISLRLKKKDEKEPPSDPLRLEFFRARPWKTPSDAKTESLYLLSSASDPLFELDSAAETRFDKKLKELRLSKIMTSTDKFNTKKIVLSSPQLGESGILLTSENGTWKRENQKEPADSQQVQAFLDQLSGNKIVDYLSQVPPGTRASPDEWKVQLIDDQGKTLRDLFFWKVGKQLYGRPQTAGNEIKEVWLLESTIADVLPRDKNAFMKKDKALPSSNPSSDPLPHLQEDPVHESQQ